MKMKGFRYVVLALAVIFPLFLCSCAVSQRAAYTVPQQIISAHPWTDKAVLDSTEKFQFAVISDLTGGRRSAVFEQAVEKLNLMQPSFVMCIGDLTEGYTKDLVQIKQERDSFKKEVDSLDMRFYFVPGNHDISNIVMYDEWKERYGSHYYHFIYKNVLFLCLNTEDPPATRMSPEQVEYVQQTLEKYQDVRWTFVFMHKPMWLEQEGKESGWQAIAAMLANRSHTIFAGHYHFYMYCKRNGQDNIVLSTTGGSSDLRGMGLGEFDHIVWVTMTEKNPIIANLELSGILPKDVVTEEIAQINSTLLDASYVHTDGIVSEEQIFREGMGELMFINKQPCPLNIEANFAEHIQVRLKPNTFQFELPIDATKKISIRTIALKPIDLLELEPLILKLSATYQLPNKKPVVVQSQHLVDIHGAHEGSEILENGIFDGDGQPWFIWTHTPETGIVSISDGELKVALDQPENWWSAGVGQNIGSLRSGGRYRVTLSANNTGGAGLIHFQIGMEEQNMPVRILINGKLNQNEPLRIDNIMKKYVVEFVVPKDLNLKRARLQFCLGDLRDAHIDDVSIREIVGKLSNE